MQFLMDKDVKIKRG